MKILYIHTYYQQKGGEDAVFQQEYTLLDQAAEVQILTFQNKPGWRGAVQFFLSLWNVFACEKLKDRIQLFQPDIIHVHNWHFAIGPIVIRAAKKRNIPVILTLHNYRLLCPSATLSYKGRLFTDSVEASFPWKAIRNKAYRNSSLQTFWLAFIIWFHKRIGTWQLVDRYIVLTEFSKSIFGASSLNIASEKLVVKPNFVDRPDSKGTGTDPKGFLFIGRLSEEKGIRILLDAFRLTNCTLGIGGEGPLKNEVLKACKENKNIKYIGNLDKSEVDRAMMEYQVLIFPSTWYEGMPMTILEAFASGLPVISSNLGAMASMIRHGYNGLHFEPGNTEDLMDKLSYWQTLTETQKANYRRNAHATFLEHYMPEKNKERLLEIYHSVAGK